MLSFRDFNKQGQAARYTEKPHDKCLPRNKSTTIFRHQVMTNLPDIGVELFYSLL